MRFKRYVFICLNERPEGHPRGSCAAHGGNAVFEAFKEQLKEKKLALEVRVNRTGCMELCEIGPNVLIHPDNIWYMKVKPEDVAEIVESHLVGNQPVERLKSDFSRWNKQLGL